MWTVSISLALAVAVFPGLLLLAASSIGDGTAGPGESWTWVAVWAGAGTMLPDVALLAVVPVQAAVLVRVFWAVEAAQPIDGPSTRRAPGAIAAAALLPCLVATGFGGPVLAASPAGPVLAESEQLVACANLACDSWQSLPVASPATGPILTVDRAGTLHAVEADGSRLRLVSLSGNGLATDGALPAPDRTRVIALTIGGDGRPRLLLGGPSGMLTIACATTGCRG